MGTRGGMGEVGSKRASGILPLLASRMRAQGFEGSFFLVDLKHKSGNLNHRKGKTGPEVRY